MQPAATPPTDTAPVKPPATGWARRLWRDWLLPLVAAAAVLLPIRSAIADWNDVPTGSMRPTILEGDRVWVNKLAYGLQVPFTHTWVATWGGPQRGDIVTLASPASGERLVKRVVGVPGDKISLRANRLIINGTESSYSLRERDILEPFQDMRLPASILNESLGGRDHSVTQLHTPTGRADFGELSVPEGCYFVMGDNRDLSLDSRVFGVVKREMIYGRVGGIALSLDPERWYAPRWSRFFTSLR